MGKRVCELFAGVGGFRLGLEKAGWDVVWSNQWEPGKKVQHASSCYVSQFGADGHSNEDIATVDKSTIPDHDLMVGGFPCQDYSVATTKAKGLQGKKGVLWWQIYEALEAKRPSFAIFENVDRLLKSPTTQRGRDFGIILWCLNQLGYRVEWRVINAGDYGFPQKRRRVFIFAARNDTLQARRAADAQDKHQWLREDGFFGGEFAVERLANTRLTNEPPPNFRLMADVERLSNEFAARFENSGVMVDGDVWTLKLRPVPIERSIEGTLAWHLEKDAHEDYYIHPESRKSWEYLKGAKREARTAKTGFAYNYSEGPLPFPDPLDRPARTILTNEGGPSPSRFKHVILDPKEERLRRLTPVEVERLNGFPDNWTAELPHGWRYFTMGNALVVGLVERMGHRLDALLEPEDAARELNPITASMPKGRAR